MFLVTSISHLWEVQDQKKFFPIIKCSRFFACKNCCSPVKLEIGGVHKTCDCHLKLNLSFTNWWAGGRAWTEAPWTIWTIVFLCPVLFVCQDIEVEYEFLRVLEDTKMKRANFVCKYGPVMRAGNTLDDIGKPAIDPFNKKKEPVVILQEHIIVNDVRLVDILKRYDPTGAFSVTPEDFMAALEVRSSSHCRDHACSFATCSFLLLSFSIYILLLFEK